MHVVLESSMQNKLYSDIPSNVLQQVIHASHLGNTGSYHMQFKNLLSFPALCALQWCARLSTVTRKSRHLM
jgi:hypothetical protein